MVFNIEYNSKRGFTLIELVIVLFIFSILLAVTLPIGINFYTSWQLDTNTYQIVQTLRRAQAKAMSGQEDSTFGVYFDYLNKKYVLFKGASYSPVKSDNEEFYMPAFLTLQASFTDVVFSKIDGLPSSYGKIIVKTDHSSRTVNINPLGSISWP